MRKEVSFAIIIGIILGGVILFGINLANQSTSNLPKEPTPSIITPTPLSENNPTSTIDDQPSTISIPSFADNDVVFETPLVLAGTASPNSPLSIISENDDLLLNTGADGIFTSSINLIPGLNKITLSQPNQDKTIVSKTLNLYYSTKPLEWRK